MPLAPEYYTADMVRSLPDDGRRYELVHGELLVTPAPRRAHQRVVVRLIQALGPYCVRERLGEVMTSPADISWSDATLVQPDVFVVAREQSGGAEWREIRDLDLVIEVLSPSTARQDRFQKRKLYQAMGVGTLWLIDLEQRRVEVWRPDSLFPDLETTRLRWAPSGASVPLELDLGGLLDGC